MTPKRIQRRRTKGYKLPPGAVCVTRPGKWGNPFQVGKLSKFGDVPDAATAVAFYRAWIDKGLQRIAIRQALRGKDLACWCRLCDEHQDGLPLGVVCAKCDPCHATELLRIANQ